MRRIDCHDAIKQVRSNHQNTLQTVNLLLTLVSQQPELLFDANITVAQMRAFAAELHDVYFARMFACFESSLRHYWRAKIRKSKPSTEQWVHSH